MNWDNSNDDEEFLHKLAQRSGTTERLDSNYTGGTDKSTATSTPLLGHSYSNGSFQFRRQPSSDHFPTVTTTSPIAVKSCWECDFTTPMTSRPHFMITTSNATTTTTAVAETAPAAGFSSSGTTELQQQQIHSSSNPLHPHSQQQHHSQPQHQRHTVLNVIPAAGTAAGTAIATKRQRSRSLGSEKEAAKHRLNKFNYRTGMVPWSAMNNYLQHPLSTSSSSSSPPDSNILVVDGRDDDSYNNNHYHHDHEENIEPADAENIVESGMFGMDSIPQVEASGIHEEKIQLLRFPEKTYSEAMLEQMVYSSQKALSIMEGDNDANSSDDDDEHPEQHTQHHHPHHHHHQLSDEGQKLLSTSLSASAPSSTNSIGICILYGMINATIVLPVLMSFASIIYQHSAFSPYMPVLVRLTLISGIIHQLCFSTFSSLPFAVGQVQDAGLIFLSSMASYMVAYCRQDCALIHNSSLSSPSSEGANINGRCDDDATMLATVTVVLGLSTAVLGIGLILIGKWKLAQYVQMLPTSVVGGYLAFIGWFCGISGIRLMAGARSDGPSLLTVVQQQWWLVLPGIVGGLFIYTAVRTLRHMAVLPTCIAFLLVLFYVVLAVTDTTVEEATDQGWIRAMDPPPVWYHTWDYIRFDKVRWSVIPQLLATELGMILVVALSSSLDVAAIELEVKCPLNYNRELTTVGLSNLVSGLTGGYTGSYIFSQTIFSLRAGIRSRVAGFALAACQMVVLVLPFPLLSYVPNFFFGSLLIMICVDLMYEWLWDVHNRVTPTEYVIDLFTFGMIQWLGVEYGIFAGILLYMGCQRVGLDVGAVKSVAVAHGHAPPQHHGHGHDPDDKLMMLMEDSALQQQHNGHHGSNSRQPYTTTSANGTARNYGTL